MTDWEATIRTEAKRDLRLMKNAARRFDKTLQTVELEWSEDLEAKAWKAWGRLDERAYSAALHYHPAMKAEAKTISRTARSKMEDARERGRANHRGLLEAAEVEARMAARKEAAEVEARRRVWA